MNILKSKVWIAFPLNFVLFTCISKINFIHIDQGHYLFIIIILKQTELKMRKIYARHPFLTHIENYVCIKYTNCIIE